MLWSNTDASSEDIASDLRKFHEHFRHEHLLFYNNFPMKTFVEPILRYVCIGRAGGPPSAAMREGLLGMPAVNIGPPQSRPQTRRQRHRRRL
jgi:hypothetical protein